MGPRFQSSTGMLWVRASPLGYSDMIAGGLILTAVVISSFLWGYGKRLKKTRGKPSIVASSDRTGNEAEKPDCFLVAPSKPAVAVQVSNETSLFEDACFDPERDYAQVLTEARAHVSEFPSYDCSHWRPTPSTGVKDFMAMDALCQLEPGLPTHATSASSNSSKSWRSFLFWQRGNKDETRKLDFYISYSTPQHPSFRHPREEGHKLRRGQSGPIYTDGLPFATSNNFRRQKSGRIESSSESIYGMGQMLSPYHPLHSSRPCSRNPSTLLYAV